VYHNPFSLTPVTGTSHLQVTAAKAGLTVGNQPAADCGETGKEALPTLKN